MELITLLRLRIRGLNHDPRRATHLASRIEFSCRRCSAWGTYHRIRQTAVGDVFSKPCPKNAVPRT